MSAWYLVGAYIGLAILTHLGARYSAVDYLWMALIVSVCLIGFEIFKFDHPPK
jgi:hypothetical protein